jgi:hypothetical protein
MTEPSPIERAVMRRVRRISWLRLVVSGGVFALGVALLALWGIGREVWVAKVFENAPHQDLIAAGRFFLSAVIGTRLVVQALIAVALAATIYLARETARLLGVLAVRSA